MTRGRQALNSLLKIGLVGVRLDELLKAGQYEQVAELLQEAQTASKGMGDVILTHTLDAARRICLLCVQCRAEAEWHQRVCEKTRQRERDSRRQLYAILDLIAERQSPETWEKHQESLGVPTVEVGPPKRGPPQALGRLSLWQRVQALLGWQTSSQSPESELSPVFAEPLVVFPTEGKKDRLSPSLAIYCLGAFRVYQNDQLITDWNGLLARSIFKYLAAHGGTPVCKDILMDLFWPDATLEAARRNLHQAMYSLRQTLRRGQSDFQHIQFEDNCYLLNPQIDIWLDLDEFEKHIQTGQRLEAVGKLARAMAEYGIAEGLYQGDFLGEDLYEDWPNLQREHIRNMYLDVVDRLSEYYVQQGEYHAAIALCQKVLARDNCYEDAHRRLMQCCLAQGQRHLAVRQYQTCVEALKEELGLAPSEETEALYRCIAAAP